jgi:hypothetical protein
MTVATDNDGSRQTVSSSYNVATELPTDNVATVPVNTHNDRLTDNGWWRQKAIDCH